MERRGHAALSRRHARVAAVTALLLAGALGAVAATSAIGRETAANARGTTSARGATVLRRTVAVVGRYRVVVRLRARRRSSEMVTVYVTGHAPRRVQAFHRHSSSLTYALVVTRSTRLTIEAVSEGPAVHVTVKTTLRAAQKQPAPALVTTTTVATTTTTSAPAPPPPPPPPAQAPNPYTSLVWSEDFQQEYGAATATSHAATAPFAATNWGYDSWGGCGASLSSTAPPAAQSDTYLANQGLAIGVSGNGQGSSYTTAQIDTAGHGNLGWQYGAIEASITLPTGQGLCPAFWLLGQNGGGEIDVLEAPSFVNSAFGPLAPYSIFTLHANNQQIFESHVTPAGWNPAVPNVYGVIWTPTTITWTINGVAYASASPASLALADGTSESAMWSAFTGSKFNLVFDEAVGGWPGPPAPGTTFSSPMYVQWVKVFQ
jgi:hypothetical protein